MDDVGVTQAGSRNVSELRAGLEGMLTTQLNVTGSVTQQIGDRGWSDTVCMLCIKYSF